MKNEQFYVGDPPGWLDQWNYSQPSPEIRKVKRITKTVDKYNTDGKLISREVITEEEEIIDKQIWPSTDIIVTDSTNLDITSNNGDFSTLTNGMQVSNYVANY